MECLRCSPLPEIYDYGLSSILPEVKSSSPIKFPMGCAVAVALAKVASDVKAGDIKVLFVKPLVYWTRFFIIATGFSRPQIDAIGYDNHYITYALILTAGCIFIFCTR